MPALGAPADRRGRSRDFWRFWTGETISSLGSSFTQFALPLLVFKLTGSALDLGIAFAVSYLPYLLFGLMIGAWVDRLDRKRVMILADLGQAAVVAALPVAFLFGALDVWWIYGVAFLSTTLHIFTDSSQFAAIPSLVGQSDLVTANGRIQASFFGATVLGPLLAGVLISLMPVATLLFIDAASFLVSALMLSLITRSFNLDDSGDGTPKSARTSIRQDILEGLRYLFGHPLLRSILIMIPLLNLFSATRDAQLVVLAEGHLHATDAQFGLLNAAGGAGVVIFSLLAGPLRKRGGYIRLALVAGLLGSLATMALALSPTIWIAIPMWGLVFGTDYLFNIYSNSLRQEILPNEMLGRARSVAAVVSFTVLPPGALLGGAIIKATGNVVLVYAGTGVALLLIFTVFSFPILAAAKQLRLGEYARQAHPVPEALVAGETGEPESRAVQPTTR
jgi:MFS family permease